MNPIVAEWMEKAHGDYATARRELVAAPDPNYDAVCFHAQQAVEKLMKAVLIQEGAVPPRTHDLMILHELLRAGDATLDCSTSDLRALTLGAVQFRYPGTFASRADASDALAACGRVRAELLKRLPSPA